MIRRSMCVGKERARRPKTAVSGIFSDSWLLRGSRCICPTIGFLSPRDWHGELCLLAAESWIRPLRERFQVRAQTLECEEAQHPKREFNMNVNNLVACSALYIKLAKRGAGYLCYFNEVSTDNENPLNEPQAGSKAGNWKKMSDRTSRGMALRFWVCCLAVNNFAWKWGNLGLNVASCRNGDSVQQWWCWTLNKSGTD